MAEVLYTGTLSAQQLTQLIIDCAFSSDARFLGEQLPDHTIDEAERKNLLLFSWYMSNLPFTSYTTGRIFHLNGELRWKRDTNKFQVVYLGSDQYMNVLERHTCTIQRDFTNLINEKKLKNIPNHYVLFGKSLAEDSRQLETPENHSTYAEARIPRLLHYPLPTPRGDQHRERVRIYVAEYVCEESGQIFAYRFQTLQAI